MDDRPEIRSHLESFGIRHFEEAEYWKWGGGKIGARRVRALNRLRAPLAQEIATHGQRQRFYEYIATEQIVNVVASMKADAIAASGLAAQKYLAKCERIIDLGCSVGYLTTWYAKQLPLASIVGIDCVPANITTAVSEAAKRGLDNCGFQVADAGMLATSHPFDAIVDTQTLLWGSQEELLATEKTLHSLLAQATSKVVFISIPPLGTSEEARVLMELLTRVNLGLTHFRFALFDDLSERGAYPVFVARKSKKHMSVDFDHEYQRILTLLAE